MSKHLWRVYDCVFMAVLLLLVFDLSLRLSPIVSAATVTPIATATTIATATPINTATPIATVTPMAVYTEDLSINPWDVLRGGGEDGIVYCSPNNEYSWCTTDGKELMYDLVVISTPDIFGGPAPLTTATPTPIATSVPITGREWYLAYDGGSKEYAESLPIAAMWSAAGTTLNGKTEVGIKTISSGDKFRLYGSVVFTCTRADRSSNVYIHRPTTSIDNYAYFDLAYSVNGGSWSYCSWSQSGGMTCPEYLYSSNVLCSAADPFFAYVDAIITYTASINELDRYSIYASSYCGTACPTAAQVSWDLISLAYDFYASNPLFEPTPTPEPTPDEDSFQIIPNCEDEDAEYLALLGNLGDWTISSITAPFDFEFLPSDGSPAYIDTIYMTDTMEYGYYWDIDEIELSFEPDYVPWVKYYRWVCLDDDLEVVGDDLGDLGDIIDDWVSVRDGSATCFTIPLETITTIYGTFDQILEILPDIEVQEDIKICMFPRIVTFETHLSFLNPFAILIMWAFTGMIVFGILRGI